MQALWHPASLLPAGSARVHTLRVYVWGCLLLSSTEFPALCRTTEAGPLCLATTSSGLQYEAEATWEVQDPGEHGGEQGTLLGPAGSGEQTFGFALSPCGFVCHIASLRPTLPAMLTPRAALSRLAAHLVFPVAFCWWYPVRTQDSGATQGSGMWKAHSSPQGQGSRI